MLVLHNLAYLSQYFKAESLQYLIRKYGIPAHILPLLASSCHIILNNLMYVSQYLKTDPRLIPKTFHVNMWRIPAVFPLPEFTNIFHCFFLFYKRSPYKNRVFAEWCKCAIVFVVFATTWYVYLYCSYIQNTKFLLS